MCLNSEVGCMCFVLVIYDVMWEGVVVLFWKSCVSVIIYGYMYCFVCYVELGGICWVLFDWDFDYGMLCGGYLCVDVEGIYVMLFD